RAKQRHALPSGDGARGMRREIGVQVGRGREDRAGHVVGTDVVAVDERAQQLGGAITDQRGVVSLDRGRAANAADHAVASRSARTRDDSSCSPPRSIASISALPTTTASATPRSARTCSGREIPKPTATGAVAYRRTRATNVATSSASAARAPVTQVSDTQ